MATQLQIRRGTTAQMNAFTGAEGELAVNTSTDTVHVHDGSTAGGFALAKADGSNIGTYAGSFTTISASGAITGNVTGNLTGSVLTAAQTNITSVGTLSTLAVTGEITANGGIALGDNDKATFGASDDLQIYHDGSNSYIDEAGQGTLYVRADSATTIANPSNTISARFRPSTSVSLYYNGVEKLATTSTGIDVTGTATMGAMNVTSGLASGTGIGAGGANGNLRLYANGTQVVTVATTGSVGIGTSSPDTTLHLQTPSGTKSEINFAQTAVTNYRIGVPASTDALVVTYGASTERLRIDSSGNVGIGTASPISFGANTAGLTVNGSSGSHITWQNNGTNVAFAYPVGNNFYIGSEQAGGNTVFTAAGAERMRIDSSGNLLVAGSATPTWVGTGPGVSLQGTYPVIGWEPIGGDKRIIYAAANNQVFYNATDTRADGFIDGTGILHWQSQYTNTTANAANCWVGTTGYIFRSTSSIKYKRDVETMEDTYADAILDVRPVFYRSTSDEDDQSHGYWGIIAEELAEIDPRLVHWTTDKTVIDEPAVYKDVDGVSTLVVPETYKQVLLDTPEPEGVQYERFIPHLINLAKRQRDQITAQAAAITDLTTRLTALENN